MHQEFRRKASHVLACGVEDVNFGKYRSDIAFQNRSSQVLQSGTADQPEYAKRIFLADLVATERD